MAIAAAGTALGICYAFHPINCGSLDTPSCPDHANGWDIQCTSGGTKQSNYETGTGYYLTSTNGTCVYSCDYGYLGNTNRTFCGYITNTWDDYTPNNVKCPSGGSGS